jgi:N-acyl-D-aspartate/D-glutamate deacylase
VSGFFHRYLLPGFVFASAVIAGGYATGRELVEFFLPTGPAGGLLGMVVSMGVWSAVYVREEKVDSLPDAIRRLTRLPAENWKLRDRDCLYVGCYADVVIFDPATIQDHATFEHPHQYATGVRDVFANGVQVLKDGEATVARPGRFVHGPGFRGDAP